MEAIKVKRDEKLSPTTINFIQSESRQLKEQKG